VIAVNILFE